MIGVREFIEYMDSGKKVIGGTKIHECMERLSQEALQLTAELNGCYHTPEEIRDLMERLTKKPVDESLGSFRPFIQTAGKTLLLENMCFLIPDVSFRIREGSLSVTVP